MAAAQARRPRARSSRRLVALLLFEVGSLPTFQAVRRFPEVAPVVLYAFLAGFSEPFVLGVVQGLVGARGTPPQARSGRGTRPRPHPVARLASGAIALSAAQADRTGRQGAPPR